MASQHTGNVEPSIDLEEHRSINGVNAKAVVSYGFDGTTLSPLKSDTVTLRMDDTGTYTYIGEATPGTATSAASWRIKRLTNADNTLVWINGNSGFTNIWDNHASGSYS